MKTKIISVPIFLLITIGFLTNCSLFDGEYQVKVPEKGENSFVCYVNGKKFVPTTTGNLNNIKGSVNYPLTVHLDKSNNINTFQITASLDDRHIIIFLSDFKTTGKFELGYAQKGSSSCKLRFHSEWDNYYQTNENPFSGIVTITEFSGSKFKGEFNAKLYRKNNHNDSLFITKGRFDINLNTLKYPYK